MDTAATHQEIASAKAIQEAIEWLVNDARYLARCARVYRQRGDVWLAEKVRANAAHSLKVARSYQTRGLAN